MTIEIDQSQFTRVCIANEKTLRYGADPAREAALTAVRSRPNRQSIAREFCEPVERIAAQRERILEKLQIQSPDQLGEIAVRFASWGNGPPRHEGAGLRCRASVAEGVAKTNQPDLR
jgi:hypothetical protein